MGSLLRREGLYSSHLTTWKKQSEKGELAALAPKNVEGKLIILIPYHQGENIRE